MNQSVKFFKPIKKKNPISDDKTPWWFGLHIKDLIRPISIKRISLFYTVLLFGFLLSGFYYTWENYLREPTGEEFVDRIVEAAGGMDAWNLIKQGSFTRNHNIYDEGSELLKTSKETFYFKNSEQGFKLQVKSIGSDNSVVWLGKDNEGYWASRDNLMVDPEETAHEEGMMCDGKFCVPLCASTMAFFRFSMPFKLKDKGVIASLGYTELNLIDVNNLDTTDKKPTLLDISYEPKIGKDHWRFYVDSKDKLIHKMEYYNKSDIGEIRPEEIYWTDHKTVDGITISHRWIRYWPNGKIMDEYLYSDINFKKEINDTFFDRSESNDLVIN